MSWFRSVREKSLTRSFNVLGTGLLVFGAEELGTVAAEPGAELGELLLEARDRLLVHVGLCDDLGHVDCREEGELVMNWERVEAKVGK